MPGFATKKMLFEGVARESGEEEGDVPGGRW